MAILEIFQPYRDIFNGKPSKICNIPECVSMGKAAVILSTILLSSIPSYEVSGRSNSPNSAAVLGAKGPATKDVAFVFGEGPRKSPLCCCG